MSPGLGVAWRFAALAGLAVGLALAPTGARPTLSPPLLAALGAALAAARPGGRGRVPWTLLVAAVGVAAGLSLGVARLDALDGRALSLPEGERVAARGTVATTPRTTNGVTGFVLEVDGGRVAVESRGDPAGIDAGRVVRVVGRAGTPSPWQAEALLRSGATSLVEAERVRLTPATRGGVAGSLDDIRRRAEAALERGTPAASAALLRGFVLGQDDRISEPVRDEFRRSGLAHILAVSGQNVMLLALLAAPILALTGFPLRLRLVTLIALIAIYVPVAGAGPSIQRAGVMGAAGLVAALAGRPTARWYALLLAAVVTLVLHPRATADVGWQLSFAAVAGLLALAAPLARTLTGDRDPGPGRRLLAEGAAMTVAATLATAPLAAHHFGTVSLTALPANLLALPAVAPAMWLGMLAGAIGQLPGAPVEPLTALAGLSAGFIGWVARFLGGRPAQVEVAEPGLGVAIALAGALVLGALLACVAVGRRARLGPAARGRLRPLAAAAAGLAICLAIAIGLAPGLRAPTADDGPEAPLVIRVLDVGQGDAILLEPRGALPILIDVGPPDGGVVGRLAELGIQRLGTVVVTHDQLDHAGAIAELIARVAVDRVVHPPGAPPAYCESAGCPGMRALAAGDSLRAGRVRLDALWPPLAGADGDPNAGSLVLLARLGGFAALFTGDAEAEAAPLDPGPVDVLKVAHHGSADSGLPALLARAAPQLAVISVGSGNPYGHPATETLAELAVGGVPVRRTDQEGEIVIEIRGDGWTVG